MCDDAICSFGKWLSIPSLIYIIIGSQRSFNINTPPAGRGLDRGRSKNNLELLK